MNKEYTTEELRYLYWRRGWVPQHKISSIKESLEGIFSYSDIKLGKKGQGDVVIVNLKPLQSYTLQDYLGYTRDIDKIETVGIYTNIYWGRKYYTEMIKEINNAI